MKYVAVIVIIILFARIDVLLEYFDKANAKFSGEPPEVDVASTEFKREVIPVSEDLNIKRSPKELLLLLMEEFKVSPSQETREKAITLLNENPRILSEKLDKEVESRVFLWRDLLTNNNAELVNFILELQKIFRGENLEMLNRFLALWMDINMERFIASYVKTKDFNCSIAITHGDPIPEEEKLNDLYDREDALKSIVAKENLDLAQKTLANNCLLQVGLEIAKLAPSPAPAPLTPPTDQTASEAEASP